MLTFLTVVGTILRLFHLGTKSLWMDEAASIGLARMSWHKYAWVWWMQEGNMTAYYLMLRPWLHFGQSEAWIRLLSVLFGIAAIPAIFFLARRLTDNPTALFAAALLAVSPAHVYYSQEARSYSLTLFLVLLSSFFFARAVQQGRGKDWALWALFSILAVYAHYFAVLVLVCQALSLLLLHLGRAQWLRFLLWTATIAVLCLPGISFVLQRGNKLNLPWIPPPTPKAILHLWMFLGGSGAKFAICMVLWAAALFAIVRTLRIHGRSQEGWRQGLIVIWATLPIAITIAASLHHSVFAQKYLLVCLPATILLAALGAQTLRAKCVGAALVLMLCGMSVATDIRSASKPREDWRSATNTILSNAHPGDAIIFYPFYARIAFEYYVQRYPGTVPPIHRFAPEFYGNGDNELQLRQDLATGAPYLPRVWVVLQGGPAEPEDFARRDPATAEALAERFGPPRTRKFADLAVLQYGHPDTVR
jgi:4-amino-4-deoxy-L-arabinose transferase-like glycosyltransferase